MWVSCRVVEVGLVSCGWDMSWCLCVMCVMCVMVQNENRVLREQLDDAGGRLQAAGSQQDFERNRIRELEVVLQSPLSLTSRSRACAWWQMLLAADRVKESRTHAAARDVASQLADLNERARTLHIVCVCCFSSCSCELSPSLFLVRCSLFLAVRL